MGLLWSLASSIHFLLLSSLLSSMLTNCFPSVDRPSHECHADESYALLQFKERFVISRSASYNTASYPKTTSWMRTTDCCSWDGIECGEVTGHVIGIDLSSSQLYGSMDANSSLFSLVHLQRLDLSDNDFNHSQIPARIGELSKLRHLNISQMTESTFSGEIPPEVSKLSNLLSLVLSSYNSYVVPRNPINQLRLNISTLRSLIQNSTSLEVLRLAYVTISSSVPDILTNLTYLRTLSLSNCELYGEFPVGIFHLPNLRILNLGNNRNLKGMLPDFHSRSPINYLILQNTSFSGTVPASIGNLSSLILFWISDCHFYGSIPSSLGNLYQLALLEIGDNQFTIETFPLYLANLTHLSTLSLRNCNLSGEIPSWIMNLTNLSFLELGENNLHGEIPGSLFRLENLAALSLSSNQLEGQIEFDMFLKLKLLTFLGLSFNKLSLVDRKRSSNVNVSRIQVLSIRSCNLVKFPNFLQHLDELVGLYISDNDLKSTLPSWIWRKRSLVGLYVSHSSLTGEISPSICNLKSLKVLDLSYNNLSGMIPSCLGSFSQSLLVLKLRENKLVGLIPQTYMPRSVLKMIDFSYNNLMGQLPRALVNCRMLEYLDVSHNQINDSFPFWLGSLPNLKLISLRQNKYYGAIKCPRKYTFPKLHIIDLSHNNFSGNLPSNTMKNWKSMTTSDISQLQYEDWNFFYGDTGAYDNISYSFTISNKGIARDYEDLQHYYFMMITIDLSCNRITGEIPYVMGDLNGLIFLNLSNNMFTGNIPSSLAKLSKLEALDLSLNNLSGQIPQQLIKLTFLAFLNVSFNNLSGPIPENKQFSTFQGNSFEGNQDLCGFQLLKKCEDHARSSLPTSDDGDQESNLGSFFEFSWKIILMIGYGGGLVAGIALGNAFSSDIIRWLKRIF